MPTAPNVLMITCHDLGRSLHCYGMPTVHTPRLDAFAASGVRFTQAFCTAPQCSPSRSSLFTGRYPHANGMMGLGHRDFAWDLHPAERHLGQVLHDAGYATQLVGVHHESRHRDAAEVAARCGMEMVSFEERGEVITAQAIAHLTAFAQEDRPFYLQVGYSEPHRMIAQARHEDDYMGFIGDYITPDDTLNVTVLPYLRDTPGTRRELAELQGAVRYVDTAIGDLLDALHAQGREADTLVIFTTDHGVALPRAKCALYDPGLEVALMLRLPARGWNGGRVLDALLSNVDVFPTILDALGLPVSATVQGRSFRPLLDGEAYIPRECVYGEMTYHDYYDPRRAIRTAQHKLIVNFTAAPAFMDPSQSWRPRSDTTTPANPKLAYHPLMELYDLAADPWEQHDCADDPAYATVRTDLLAQLGAWMRDTGDPLLKGAVTSPLHTRAVTALGGQ